MSDTVDLSITVSAARNIKNVVTFGTQSPYCELQFAGQSRKTRTHKSGGRNPRWDERFTIRGVAEDYVRSNDMWVSIKNTGMVGTTTIAMAQINMAACLDGNPLTRWFPLKSGRKTYGEINLSIVASGRFNNGSNVLSSAGAAVAHSHTDSYPTYPVAAPAPAPVTPSDAPPVYNPSAGVVVAAYGASDDIPVDSYSGGAPSGPTYSAYGDNNNGKGGTYPTAAAAAYPTAAPAYPVAAPAPAAAPSYPAASPAPAYNSSYPVASAAYPASSGASGYPAADYAASTATSSYPAAQPAYSAYATASSGYPAASSAYPAASSGYGGYPAASGGYPAASGGYPAASGGYPAAQSSSYAPYGAAPSNAYGGVMSNATSPSSSAYPAAAYGGRNRLLR